jgi:putative spermidine/putrescine transport system substrate-binding protein
VKSIDSERGTIDQPTPRRPAEREGWVDVHLDAIARRIGGDALPGSRYLTRTAVVLAASAVVVAACGGNTPPAPSGTTAVTAVQSPAASELASASPSPTPGPPEALIAAAKAEGSLTTIALAHDWCNYGEVLQSFEDTYGIAINELDPGGNSEDEIAAIKAGQGDAGPGAPDVVDVGFAFGEANKDLFTPYEVTTWDSIPAEAKSADGHWYGDYFGVMSFATNTAVQPNPPKDWSDLLKPEYKGQVALDGDPRISNQAIQAVYASSLADGGSLDDAQPGLDFWKKIVDAGNFVPVDASPATIAGGSTPIAMRWSYNGMAQRDQTNGNPTIDVTVPASGQLGGMYVQAISKTAPHPNAAKLWMEHLYSDAGQLMLMKGHCNPIRYKDMLERGVISPDLAAELPDATGVAFPDAAQLTAATNLITKGWDKTVGVNVVAPSGG